MKALHTRILLCLVQLLLCSQVVAHGSVTADGDLCVISIGFYTAHFKVFQPDTSQEKEFCEDLPAAGSSIFVMEYLHQSLAEVPIEFRIVRDTTGLGRFARVDDLARIEDLEAATVFYQPPLIAPQVFTVLHDFSETGDFLGIVTVKHPDTEQYYSALFPFHVGGGGWGLLPLFAVIGVLCQTGYWISSGGLARRRKARHFGQTSHPPRAARSHARILLFAPVLLLLGAAAKHSGDQSWLSESGNMRLSFSSAVEPLPLNQIHEWTLHLETATGAPVENASIQMTGGMPAHDHGLPTDPSVTAYLGNGNYRVEGVRFHMQGEWVMKVTVSQGNGQRETVLVPLAL